MHGKLKKESARFIGYQSELREEWLHLRWEKGRQPNEKEWEQLVANQVARIDAKVERERAKKEEALKQEASRFGDRTSKLTPQAVAGLQSAKQGRTASLGEALPGIVVKVADDPVHDLAIIEHIWARHAMALSEKVDKSRLNVINLFPDPVGDVIFGRVQNAIGKASGKDASASKILTNMLTGKQPFDGALLSSTLNGLAGQAFYIVSHIPEAQPGRGQLEFEGASAPVLTNISMLQEAFQAAKVNLFIVGCSSSKHTTMGLSKDINNVDALTRFLEAVQSTEPRTLFAWHAAFAADALVVIDPLASEVFGRGASEHALSGVTLVTNGKSVSHGYAGTYATPPAVPGVSATPSVALAVAAHQLTPPQRCPTDPSPMQRAAAEKFAPAGMTLLALTLVVSMMLAFRHEVKNKGTEYGASLLIPVIAGAPILIAAYNWPLGNGAYGPGPWLGAWCLVYAIALGLMGLSEEKRLNAGVLIAVALAGCAVLFGASYFGVMADPSMRAYCNSFAAARQ